MGDARRIGIRWEQKWRRRRKKEETLITILTPPRRSILPPPALPTQPPLTVKLFRATSGACLINFSFLQITISETRRATESHNHYKLRGCLPAVTRRERDRGGGRGGGGGKVGINDCIIP